MEINEEFDCCPNINNNAIDYSNFSRPHEISIYGGASDQNLMARLSSFTNRSNNDRSSLR